MDISTLFLGSGFALLIALLAWGNQMREPRREIRQLENECRQWLQLGKNELTPLIRTEKYSTTEKMKSLMTIVGNRNITTKKQLVTIRKMDDLNKEWAKLDKFYKRRYQFSVILMIFLFILGGLALYTNDVTITMGSYSFFISRMYFVIIIIIFIVILNNLIKTHFKEERFVNGILDAWDSIGGK